jgi:flagellar hook protein FlgE
MGSALSGLDAQQFALNVIGNNLANATTTGYKAQTVNFSTLLSQTIRFGSAPQGALGGFDPIQLGLGVQVEASQRDFSQGQLQTTGVASNVAINGDGFFILNNGQAGQVYTRDGAFSLNSQGVLIDPGTGFAVQGINADLTTFTIPAGGPIGNVSIPVGNLELASPTTKAIFDGNLNSGGAVANGGTTLQSAQLVDNTAANAPATTATLLTNLSRANGAGFLDLNINNGDTVTVNATKGGNPLPEQKFFVGTSLPVGYDGFGTTLGDFSSFLQRALGINTGSLADYSAIRKNSTDPNATGVSRSVPAGTVFSTTANWTLTDPSVANFGSAGLGVQPGDIIRFNSGPGAGQAANVVAVAGSTLTLSALSTKYPLPVAGDQYTVNLPAGTTVAGAATPWLTQGALEVAGNAGTANALAGLTIQDTTNNISFSPFTQIDAANGESVSTNGLVFDSIGNSHTVTFTFVLSAQGVVDPASGAVGNTWQVFVESPDSKLLGVSGNLLGTNRVVGGGQILFSTAGQFLNQTPGPNGFATLEIPNKGSVTPLTFTPDFSAMTGFANTQSTAFLASQDGLPTGSLTSFSIGQTGIVTGVFSNGATRPLAQILLARFQNPNGLTDLGHNLFQAASSSGNPLVAPPAVGSNGTLTGGALEQSNVDFAKELTNLIVSQRAFQANAKVITRVDQILDELMTSI